MNREDIMKLAKECGNWSGQTVEMNDVGLERFAALVAAAERDRIADEAKHIIKRAEARGAAAEREACAKVCDEIANKPSNMVLGVAINCASAIRERNK